MNKKTKPFKPKPALYQSNECKTYGLHACLTLFKERPQDLIKLYLQTDKLKLLSDVVGFCVKNRLAYKVVSPDELQKITESVHHEGVCFIARQKVSLKFGDFLKIIQSKKRSEPLLFTYLDGVQNPHNVGNMIRSLAHFGCTSLLSSDKNLDPLPPSTHRVSMGGSEVVQNIYLPQPLKNLKELKELGFALVATSSHTRTSLWQNPLPKRMVLVMGSESLGVSKEILAEASHQIKIPGTDSVESLNVASAQAVILADFYRQHLVN